MTNHTGKHHARTVGHRRIMVSGGPRRRLGMVANLLCIVSTLLACHIVPCRAMDVIRGTCARLAYGSGEDNAHPVHLLWHPPDGALGCSANVLRSSTPGITWMDGSMSIRPGPITIDHHGHGGGGGGRGGAEQGGTGRGRLRSETPAAFNAIANVLADVQSADGGTSGYTSVKGSALAMERFADVDERIAEEEVEIRIPQLVVVQVSRGRVWPPRRNVGLPWRSLSIARGKVHGGNVRAAATTLDHAVRSNGKADCVRIDSTAYFNAAVYVYSSTGKSDVGRVKVVELGGGGSGRDEGEGRRAIGGEGGDWDAQDNTATLAHVVPPHRRHAPHTRRHRRTCTPHQPRTSQHACLACDPVLVVVGVRVLTSWADLPGSSGRRAWGGGSCGV